MSQKHNVCCIHTLGREENEKQVFLRKIESRMWSIVRMAALKTSWGAWGNTPPSRGSVPMGSLQMFLKAQCLHLGLSFPNTGLHHGSSHDQENAPGKEQQIRGPWPRGHGICFLLQGSFWPKVLISVDIQYGASDYILL